jgi:hypothetical protein
MLKEIVNMFSKKKGVVPPVAWSSVKDNINNIPEKTELNKAIATCFACGWFGRNKELCAGCPEGKMLPTTFVAIHKMLN